MKIKKGFVLRQVCGENVIVGEGLDAINFGRMLCLNETAAWLWKKAQDTGDFTVESLANALCEEFEVTPEQALTDVKDTIDSWTDIGVIE
ncbi:MAG: PqqD family protein [Bacteroidaceae bacterium]|nr:PqqD family protein [Bacteroidaceae bacterium]MBO7589269.1 PqqD family protein [Bacteroidaceae bacterium]MBP5647540.1 PqqD family protein [Bacteroidaceae bacterium]